MPLLLCGLVAEAQPAAGVRPGQQLVAAEQPSRTELELSVAQGLTTLVRVDEDVKLLEVKLAGLEEHVSVDVASRALLLEPLRPLAPGERLPLELLLQQGAVRTRVVLLLVSRPGRVDTQVNLELRPRLTARQAPPKRPSPAAPEDEALPLAVLSEEVDTSGATTPFRGKALGTEVKVKKSWHYRAADTWLIALRVYNPEGARPWSASEVVRVSPAGIALPGSSGWTVTMKGPIAPGSDQPLVLKAPPGEPDEPVRLEVREKGGGRNVRLEERR